MTHYTVEENNISDDMTVYDVVRWEGPHGNPVATVGDRAVAVKRAATLNGEYTSFKKWERDQIAVLEKHLGMNKSRAKWLLIAVPVAMFMASVVYHWFK